MQDHYEYNNKFKKEEKKMNFTKIIFVAILFTYLIGVGAGVYVVVQDCGQFGILATYIATPTTAIITLYCWKAKAENMIKMKQGYPEETKDTSINLNNIADME